MELVSDFTVCSTGDILTPNQAALLRAFEVKMAVFHMLPIGWYNGENHCYFPADVSVSRFECTGMNGNECRLL